MYYVIKNGDSYMGKDGMLTPNRSDALRVDPALVAAVRQGGWANAGLFAEVYAGDPNFGRGVRLVRVNESGNAQPSSDAPVYSDGVRVN